MGETKTESAHPHSWAFAKPDSSVMKAPPAEAQARRPEFSQCFGDKAAPEELTEGESVSTSTDSRSPLPCSHMLEDMSAAWHPGARPALRSGVDGVRGWHVVGAADLLTTVEFDESGDYLATGDRGGRVVIFEKGDDIKQVRASCEERRGRWRGREGSLLSGPTTWRTVTRGGGGSRRGGGGAAHGDASCPTDDAGAALRSPQARLQVQVLQRGACPLVASGRRTSRPFARPGDS